MNRYCALFSFGFVASLLCGSAALCTDDFFSEDVPAYSVFAPPQAVPAADTDTLAPAPARELSEDEKALPEMDGPELAEAPAVSPAPPATITTDDSAAPDSANSAEARTGLPREQMPPAIGAARNDPGSLSITLAEAVLLSIDNNIELQSRKLGPVKAEEYIRIARAAFDPSVSASVSRKFYDHSHDTASGVTKSHNDDFSASISEFAPTGTTIKLDASIADSYSKSYTGRRTSTQRWSGSSGVNISQALLRGRGPEVNLVELRTARLNLAISQYQLQNYVEDLLVNVENTYWDGVLARQETEIIRDSLTIARQLLNETEEKIKVGRLPKVDLAEAKATVAERNVQLIEASNRYEKIRLALIKLLNPQGENKWILPLALDAMPEAPAVELDPVDDHVMLALQNRPDMNESRLQIRKGELNLVKTANGLLPKLDFFVDARGGGGNYYNSSYDYHGNDHFTLRGGLSFDYVLGNRARRAQHELSEYDLTQTRLALDNLAQTIQVQVRSAYLDVQRYHAQIEATNLARQQYELSLLAEQEKFRVGKSTNIAVSIAQTNYLQSRLNEARAVINTIKSLTALYRYDGSLLPRRGMVLPGY